MSFWEDYTDRYVHCGENPLEDFYKDTLPSFLPQEFAVKSKTKDNLDIILLITGNQISHLIINPLKFFEFYAREGFIYEINELLHCIKNSSDNNDIKIYLDDTELSYCSSIEEIEHIHIENYSHFSCFETFKESSLEFIKDEDCGPCLLFDIVNSIPIEYAYDYLPTILILIKLTKFDSGLSRLGIHSGTTVREFSLNSWFSFDEFYRKNSYCLTSKIKLKQYGLFCDKKKYDQFIDKDKPNKFYTSLRQEKSFNGVKDLIVNFVIESIEHNTAKQPFEGGYIPKLHNQIKGFIHDHANQWLQHGEIVLKESTSEIYRINFNKICSEISNIHNLNEGHLALHIPAIFSKVEKVLQEIARYSD